ncbi:MAG: hypothetical protein HDT37_00390 [Clostridiales bacterium]|nr:hypothetical protein [Clostridiales bacterium]
MAKNFELLTFEKLLNIPIDIESCFDPIFEPPVDFIEEWRRKREQENPFSCTVTRQIGNTWYIIETEYIGDELLSSLMRPMIFSDKETVQCRQNGKTMLS